MMATAKKKPVTDAAALLNHLHECFGGTIVAVDQRVDNVTIATEKHGDVEGCTAILDDRHPEGFSFLICKHHRGVSKAAYAKWNEYASEKGIPETTATEKLEAANDNQTSDEPAIDPYKPPRPGVWFTDFYSHIPSRQYIYLPNREMWPASSVNAKLPYMTR